MHAIVFAQGFWDIVKKPGGIYTKVLWHYDMIHDVYHFG